MTNPTTPPHPTAPARGDGERCEDRTGGGRYRCCLPTGHTGRHRVAESEAYLSWPNESEPTPTGTGEAVDLDAIEARLHAIVGKLRYPPHTVSVDDEGFLESVADSLHSAREEAGRLRGEVDAWQRETTAWMQEATEGRAVLAHLAERVEALEAQQEKGRVAALRARSEVEQSLAARDAELAGVREELGNLADELRAMIRDREAMGLGDYSVLNAVKHRLGMEVGHAS